MGRSERKGEVVSASCRLLGGPRGCSSACGSGARQMDSAGSAPERASPPSTPHAQFPQPSCSLSPVLTKLFVLVCSMNVNKPGIDCSAR